MPVIPIPRDSMESESATAVVLSVNTVMSREVVNIALQL